MTGTMLDSIDVAALPPGYPAYAGYVDGKWPTFAALRRRFPGARLLSVAVFASGDAQALDVEPGDASTAQTPAWVRRQAARGEARPCVYTSAANMSPLNAAMSGAGLPRARYRIWSAHYTGTPHICGPGTCGYPQADATQWTNRFQGGNVDASLYSAGFFGTPSPQEDDLMPVRLLPGKNQAPVGVSFDGAPYTTIGFLADPSYTGQAQLSVRVAMHHAGQGASWGVQHVVLTKDQPKAVLHLDKDVDGVSFTRDDDVPVVLVPNFA